MYIPLRDHMMKAFISINMDIRGPRLQRNETE